MEFFDGVTSEITANGVEGEDEARMKVDHHPMGSRRVLVHVEVDDVDAMFEGERVMHRPWDVVAFDVEGSDEFVRVLIVWRSKTFIGSGRWFR